jgi:hypothetical protein
VLDEVIFKVPPSLRIPPPLPSLAVLPEIVLEVIVKVPVLYIPPPL